MRHYSIGVNNYWRTASIHLEETPFCLFYLQRFVEWCCDKCPEIPLPPVKFKIRDPELRNEFRKTNGWTDFREWFGDTQQLFHLFVCDNMFQFTRKHTKSVVINLPYNYLKELFPKVFEFEEELGYYDEDDNALIAKNKRITDWTDQQFRELLPKLSWKYIADSTK